LTSLFSFFLGAEIECCPSSIKVKKSRKPFLVPLKETSIVRKHDLASCPTMGMGYTTTPPLGSSTFEDSPTLKTQEDYWSLQDISDKNWGEHPYTEDNGLGGNKTH
jgi:hypothetical protein